MLASIWLEKKGVPALAVCTEPFERVVEELSRVHGIPDIQWAMIPHPFGSLDEVTLANRAETIVERFYDVVLERRD